jgi:hypothetical protein
VRRRMPVIVEKWRSFHEQVVRRIGVLSQLVLIGGLIGAAGYLVYTAANAFDLGNSDSLLASGIALPVAWAIWQLVRLRAGTIPAFTISRPMLVSILGFGLGLLGLIVARLGGSVYIVYLLLWTSLATIAWAYMLFPLWAYAALRSWIPKWWGETRLAEEYAVVNLLELLFALEVERVDRADPQVQARLGGYLSRAAYAINGTLPRRLPTDPIKLGKEKRVESIRAATTLRSWHSLISPDKASTAQFARKVREALNAGAAGRWSDIKQDEAYEPGGESRSSVAWSLVRRGGGWVLGAILVLSAALGVVALRQADVLVQAAALAGPHAPLVLLLLHVFAALLPAWLAVLTARALRDRPDSLLKLAGASMKTVVKRILGP